MLTSNEIKNTLNQLELKRNRLGLTNDELKSALGVHINTLMSWKNSGYTKLQVSDLLKLIDFLDSVDKYGKDMIMRDVYANLIQETHQSSHLMATC